MKDLKIVDFAGSLYVEYIDDLDRIKNNELSPADVDRYKDFMANIVILRDELLSSFVDN